MRTLTPIHITRRELAYWRGRVPRAFSRVHPKGAPETGGYRAQRARRAYGIAGRLLHNSDRYIPAAAKRTRERGARC